MDIQKFIIEQALILVPVLYVLGMILKSSRVEDKFIPVILLIIGVALSLFLVGFNVQGVIQGVLVAGSAVFVNQVSKQLKQ